MHPKPRDDTSSPEFPSFRFCIIPLDLECRGKPRKAVIPILPIFCLILLIATLCARLGAAPQLCLERKKAMQMIRNGKHTDAPSAGASIQDRRTELANK